MINGKRNNMTKYLMQKRKYRPRNDTNANVFFKKNTKLKRHKAHDYILIHNQNTKHHSKLIAIKYGTSFALHDKWLTS